MIGIGIPNNIGGPELVSFYDSAGSLLKSHQAASEANVYSVITLGIYDISHLEIRRNYITSPTAMVAFLCEITLQGSGRIAN